MTRPVLYWVRRDLRLSDNPALMASLQTGGPVIPVFILDPETEALGAAPKWRLGEGLRVFADTLAKHGSRLILRRGDAVDVLSTLVEETNAVAVHWNRLYDPGAITRDKGVKEALKDMEVAAESHAGHILFEPWTVKTGQGEFYRVYTPFWKAVRERDPGGPLAAPARIGAPELWPQTEALSDWALGAAMDRGAAVVSKYAAIGETAARDRLDSFVRDLIDRYKADRDFLDADSTSKLSENLAVGEISARTCWCAGQRAMADGKSGAEHFLKEVVWRDFAYHLIFHTPHIAQENWREEWNGFPWRGDNADAEAWRRGRTGEPVIDAAMREMYVTGRMHNRARMLVASYLTKHLMTHWQVGMRWFDECLIDWDPASNAMGWQWAAGSGPDAAPYFRVFNPATQAEKFDRVGIYRNTYVAELTGQPGAAALDYFAAIPRSWGMSPDDAYPNRPLIGLQEGREKALAAYHNHKNNKSAA